MVEKRIRRILVEQEARDYAMTRRILARLPGVPVEVIRDREALNTSGRDRAAWLARGQDHPAAGGPKRTFLAGVSRDQGLYLLRLPGAPGHA